jgi:hypothetical protein
VAGYVGEFMSASNVIGSPVTFTSGTPKNLQTITLSAGDWDIWGNMFVTGTTIQSLQIGISQSTGTLPDESLQCYVDGLATSTAMGLFAPQQRLNVTSSTPVYLVATAAGTGTLNGGGGIYARRVR